MDRDKTTHPLYGKRKKKKVKCPNPLFLKWLQEWKEDAASKGIKTQYVYGKAIKSLLKFPLRLSSGKDAKLLEHFGDKICKMLDEKLEDHIKLYGSAELPNSDSSEDESPPRPKKSRPKKEVSVENSNKLCYSRSNIAVHEISDSDEGENGTTKKVERRRRSSDKEYVPGYRTGAYALLMALYEDTQSAGSKGFMSKMDLITTAQPLSEKSFLVPDAGSRYTAWSSMSTLIKKNLVIKESSPAKYFITELGIQLATRLKHFGADGLDKTSNGSDKRLTSCSNKDAVGLSNIPVSVENAEGLDFFYINEFGEEVTEKDKAEVFIDDHFGVGFLVKCNYQKLMESGKKYQLDTSRPVSENVYAFIGNDDAPERCRSSISITGNLNSADSIPLNTLSSKSQEKSHKPRAEGKKPKKQSFPSVSSSVSLVSHMASLKIPSLHSDLIDNSSSQDSQSSIRTISSVSSCKSLPDPDFVLYPGQFDIVLCVDNQEFYGGRKSGSNTLLPDLLKNGVNCDLRKLQVGDMLWIAKEKVDNVQGQIQLPKSKELVLDYIIERKRLDDLVHSCIDGRLPDQKFRLKHCAVRNKLFLIESYGSMQHYSIPEERIRQTITNLQIIDGFTVKRTRDTKETVAYLTVMTRLIQSLYRGKILHACSPEKVMEDAIKWQICDGEQYAVSFDMFSQGSMKSKKLSSREMFAKQLIQFHGMSAEKAKALTDKYPTLLSLIEAYDQCPTEKEKESLLSNLKTGKSLRNLGLVQSKQIYQMYCSKGALS